MNIPSKFLWPILAISGLVILAVAIYQNMPPNPSMSNLVDSKLKSIVTPKPPLEQSYACPRSSGNVEVVFNGKGVAGFWKIHDRSGHHDRDGKWRHGTHH